MIGHTNLWENPVVPEEKSCSLRSTAVRPVEPLLGNVKCLPETDPVLVHQIRHQPRIYKKLPSTSAVSSPSLGPFISAGRTLQGATKEIFFGFATQILFNWRYQVLIWGCACAVHWAVFLPSIKWSDEGKITACLPDRANLLEPGSWHFKSICPQWFSVYFLTFIWNALVRKCR